MRSMTLITMLLLATGCASTQRAALDPHVWVPLAAAALLQVNGYDEQISRSLYKNNPVFGDPENAKDWSDNLRAYTSTAYAGTALLVHQPIDERGALLVGQYMSVEAVDEIRGNLQNNIGRSRPDDSGNTSMPSGHTTTASYQASLARTNIRYMNVSASTKQALNTTVTSFAMLAGYARVEGGRHYPSDVLVGYALGNFFGVYADDFVTSRFITVLPAVSKDSAGVMVSINF